MAKCKGQLRRRRVKKPHGKFGHAGEKNPGRGTLLGHKWKGHGADRICELCGQKPKGSVHSSGNMPLIKSGA